jgi:type IV pilus assembly protein PilN
MAKINLLPWRAALRKQQQKDFASAILLGVSLTAAIMLTVHTSISSQIEHQNRRNNFLTMEIAALDKKIAEIQELEAKKKRLLARMDIIQELQSSRPLVVHLFEELAKTIPEGVYLSDLAQVEKNLTVNGFAQSNARVSAYMRNLEISGWLKEPLLNIIEAKADANVKDSGIKKSGNRFTLQIKQSGDKPGQKPGKGVS